MHGVFFHIVCHKYGSLGKLTCHKLHFLVPAYPEEDGRLGDLGKLVVMKMSMNFL